MTQAKPVLLEVYDINTYRGPAHVLRGVSINVDTNEVVALVGRNGAGRTTIIESITGLLPLRSGRIRFRDEEITSLPPHRRAKRGIGYAPENSGIFPELTVAENLMISRWLSACHTGRTPSNEKTWAMSSPWVRMALVPQMLRPTLRG